MAKVFENIKTWNETLLESLTDWAVHLRRTVNLAQSTLLCNEHSTQQLSKCSKEIPAGVKRIPVY